jgi:hypothetical protein
MHKNEVAPCKNNLCERIFYLIVIYMLKNEIITDKNH